MGLFDFLKPKRTAELAALEEGIAKLRKAAFPMGEAQIEAEAARLQTELRDRLTTDECRMLVQRTKAMILLAESRDEDRLADYVYRQLGGKLSPEESRATFLFIESLIRGRTDPGTGTSEDVPIVIHAENTFSGIAAEYQWLQEHFGVKDEDWTLVMRSHGSRNGRHIESFRIKLKNGSERNVHFDISEFFGKLF